ncbi:MAG TPA: hypothetical protein PK112_02610, partial [candidate division Zixibacteria bacterium]|nr:hypothetical protein [candidate division Zixibacteria bacterium]
MRTLIAAAVFHLLAACAAFPAFAEGILTITTYGTGSEGHLITFPDSTTMSLDCADGDITTMSHFHSDHCGSSCESSAQYHRNNTKPGDILYDKDGVIVECVASNQKVISTGWKTAGCKDVDENAYSMALLVSYGGFDYLFTGDMYGATEVPLGEALWAAGVGVDILKASHHGTDTNNSSSVEYLESISPEYVVIAGTATSPNATSLAAFKSAGVTRIYYAPNYTSSNDIVFRANGDITVTTDGETFSISGSSFNHGPYWADEASATPTPPPTRTPTRTPPR